MNLRSQSLSQLFLATYFVKCRRALLNEVEFQGTISNQAQKEKKNSSLLVYILHKIRNSALSCCTVHKKVICLLNLLVFRGCLHEKTHTGARVSYRDDLLISYRAYMMLGHFISRLFEGTLHVDKIHVLFKIANVMHALPVPVHPNSNLPSMIATKTLLLMVM